MTHNEMVATLVRECSDEQIRAMLHAECERLARLHSAALDKGWRGPNHDAHAQAWSAAMTRISHWEPCE